MAERRRVQRTRVLKSAKIITNHRSSVVDCQVRNLTNLGACLHVASTCGIPETFDLSFDGARANRHCHVIWRTDTKVGIAFDS